MASGQIEFQQTPGHNSQLFVTRMTLRKAFCAGWAMEGHLRTELVLTTLEMAVGQGYPHCQYTV
jgi:hypothetical protein